RAPLRGDRRRPRRRGAGGVDLPLRRVHRRPGARLPARARRPGPHRLRRSGRAMSRDGDGAGAEALLGEVRFDGQGLVPVIAQDAATGTVRMFAWANRDALAATARTGMAHFWSR